MEADPSGEPAAATRALLLRFSLRAKEATAEADRLANENAQLRRELELVLPEHQAGQQYQLQVDHQVKQLQETLLEAATNYEKSQNERAKHVAIIRSQRQQLDERAKTIEEQHELLESLEAATSEMTERVAPERAKQLAQLAARVQFLEQQLAASYTERRAISSAATSDSLLMQSELRIALVEAAEATAMGDQRVVHHSAASEKADNELADWARTSSELAEACEQQLNMLQGQLGAMETKLGRSKASNTALKLYLDSTLFRSRRQQLLLRGLGVWYRICADRRVAAAAQTAHRAASELLLQLQQRVEAAADMLQAAAVSTIVRDYANARHCCMLLCRAEQLHKWRRRAATTRDRRTRAAGALRWRARSKCIKRQISERAAIRQWREVVQLEAAVLQLVPRTVLRSYRRGKCKPVK